MSIEDTVLDNLVQISGAEEVRLNPDLELFDEGVLDSLGLVELIVALGEAFHLDITPTQVERAAWATPRKISADIKARLQAARQGNPENPEPV